MNILQRWHLGECNINYYDRGTSFALLVYLFDHVTTRSPQRLQHIAMLPICLHQFAKKTPVVVMMFPVVVSASSGSCQRSPAVVTELSADRHMYVYVLPLGRQYVVKQIIWRYTGDALAIFDELAVVKTAPVHRQTSPVGVKGA